jgi:hypothetical protein
MAGDASEREHQADTAVQRPSSRGAVRMPLLALGSGVGALLVPKCPLCIAAYLAPFGVTVGAAATAAGLLRPLGGVLVALAFGSILVLRRHRRVNISQGPTAVRLASTSRPPPPSATT